MQHEITFESEKRRKKMTDEKHEELVFFHLTILLHIVFNFLNRMNSIVSRFFYKQPPLLLFKFSKNQTRILACTDCVYSSE